MDRPQILPNIPCVSKIIPPFCGCTSNRNLISLNAIEIYDVGSDVSVTTKSNIKTEMSVLPRHRHLFNAFVHEKQVPRLARDISRDAIFKCDARLSTRSFFIHVRARFSSLLVRRTYVRGIMRKLPGYYERNGFCPVAALFRDRG